MTSGRLLRRARRRAGLSQRKMAQKANVPQSTVARIELGSLSPRVDTLDKLLRTAGLTVSVEPILGLGIDRTQIRELLRLSPAQRLRLGEADARALAAFDRQLRR